jgi:ATP-dependent DNA ligase
MLCKEDDSFLTREGYILERKYDGTRLLLFKDKNEIHLVSRRNIEYTHLYPELVDEAQSIVANSCILDGELTFFSHEGYDVFKPIHTSRETWMDDGLVFRYMVFDILEKNGRDLKQKPLLERKRILEETVKMTEHINLVDFHVDYQPTNGEKLFKNITEKEHGEGVVLKRKGSLYLEGSRSSWGKVKGRKVDTAWVVGFLPGKGTRANYFSSLVLAKKVNGRLEYVGRVGSGFTELDLQEITEILISLPKTDCPFEFYVCHEGKLKKATFVRPKIKVRVAYQELTKSGKFRSPVFKGLVG